MVGAQRGEGAVGVEIGIAVGSPFNRVEILCSGVGVDIYGLGIFRAGEDVEL